MERDSRSGQAGGADAAAARGRQAGAAALAGGAGGPESAVAGLALRRCARACCPFRWPGRPCAASARTTAMAAPRRAFSLAAQPAATVTAPCDGWVVYAGPFRSYGQLLIINAGGGYHVVLAGMDGSMSASASSSSPASRWRRWGRARRAWRRRRLVAPREPTLYVEFRKNGVSIDPTPWWANKGEKARG